MNQDQINPRYQAAMNAIHGDIANIGLPPLDTNVRILSEVREAMGAEVTADYGDLPLRVRAMTDAIRRSFLLVQDTKNGLLGTKTAINHLDGVLGQVLHVMQAGSGRGR